MYVDLYASITSSGGAVGGTGQIQARFQNAVTPNTANNAVASISAPGLTGTTWTAVYTQGSASSAPSGPTSGTGLFSSQVVNLPSGSEVLVTQQIAVPDGAQIGDVTISAFILPSAADTLVAPAHNESHSFFAVYHRSISLELTSAMVGTVQPGGTVQFTVSVRNADSKDLPVGSTVTEILPTGFTLVGWTAVYSGGSGGPASGTAMPVTMSPVPVGAQTVYTVVAKTSHCVEPGAFTTRARLTLPAGYTTPAHSKCIDADVSFVVDPITPSPCRKFAGGVGAARCDDGATFSGTVTVTLKSKNSKVWLPYAPSCAGGYGRFIPTGTLESVAVSSDGCWVTTYDYIANGDMIDGGDCAAEDAAMPSTSYVIVENITMTLPQQDGSTLTVPYTNSYEVRLQKGVTYAPVIDVAKLARAQAA